jgi:hypothetical protein
MLDHGVLLANSMLANDLLAIKFKRKLEKLYYYVYYYFSGNPAVSN